MVMNILLLMFIMLGSVRIVAAVRDALSTPLAGACALREWSCAAVGDQGEILLLAGAAAELVASAGVVDVGRDLLPLDLRKVGVDAVDEQLILKMVSK